MQRSKSEMLTGREKLLNKGGRNHTDARRLSSLSLSRYANAAAPCTAVNVPHPFLPPRHAN